MRGGLASYLYKGSKAVSSLELRCSMSGTASPQRHATTCEGRWREEPEWGRPNPRVGHTLATASRSLPLHGGS